MISIMTTQTWAWIHQQLDFPKYKQVKIHILRPNSCKSFCGLENHGDEGECTKFDFIRNYYHCKKCCRAVEKITVRCK